MLAPAQTVCWCEARQFLRLRRAELELVFHKKSPRYVWTQKTVQKMMRKWAAVTWRIRLQKQNQKFLLPLICHPNTTARCRERHAPTSLGGSRSTATSAEQSSSYSSALCHFGELELCTYRNTLSFQQKEVQAKIKYFLTGRERAQQRYKHCWKKDAFSNLLLPNQND